MNTAIRTVLSYPLAPFDADTRAYIKAVEAADGQPLEAGVRRALDTFVRGCKSDGIWDAIKASCVMMGARTLAGALTPLKGAAPTNNGPFVSGDYDRKTGLVGNGTTKYLDSNRDNNADPQNSASRAVFVTQALTSGSYLGSEAGLTGDDYISNNGSTIRYRHRGRQRDDGVISSTGLIGMDSSIATTFRVRSAGVTTTYTNTSATPASSSIRIFTRWFSGAPNATGNARLSFYSIGESLDLALLDARVTALQQDIWNADTADSLYMTVNIAADGGTYTLLSTGTVNYAVDWGDEKREASTSNSLVHTYATAGQYQIRVISTAAWRFYNSNNATEGPKLLSVDNVTFTGTAIGTNLISAWHGCSNLTSFPALPDTSNVISFSSAWYGCSNLTSFPALPDTSNVTSFSSAWRNCSSLTLFPALPDTSKAASFTDSWNGCSSLTSFPALPNTSEVTTFSYAWYGCSSLTSFPALPDTSKVTTFSYAWFGCSSLTSFPALPDTSEVTTFANAWQNCSSLTSFPALPNTSNVTTFANAWNGCSSLTSFPALPDTSKVTAFNGAWNGCSSLALFPSNQFDVTGTLLSTAFTSAFVNCALTAQSIENILTSLVTNGQSNIQLSLSGGTNAGASTWTPAAIAAYDTLISRGWTIARNA